MSDAETVRAVVLGTLFRLRRERRGPCPVHLIGSECRRSWRGESRFEHDEVSFALKTLQKRLDANVSRYRVRQGNAGWELIVATE